MRTKHLSLNSSATGLRYTNLHLHHDWLKVIFLDLHIFKEQEENNIHFLTVYRYLRKLGEDKLH